VPPRPATDLSSARLINLTLVCRARRSDPDTGSARSRCEQRREAGGLEPTDDAVGEGPKSRWPSTTSEVQHGTIGEIPPLGLAFLAAFDPDGGIAVEPTAPL